MADAGYTPEGLGYFDGDPLNLAVLTTVGSARTELIEKLIASHPSGTTITTPPHFLVHDEASAALNVALAEQTQQLSAKPVRATLVVSRKHLTSNADALAREYVHAGITSVEIRVTPLGGDNESVAKVRAVFAALDAFSAAGVEVVLGYSGNIGQAAVAMGHAAHYSVGIGLREQVNHAAAITRQKAPPRPPQGEGADGSNLFGAIAGSYLPGPAVTIGRKAGKTLLDNTDIRVRIGCRIGICASSVTGPAIDPREHYLHSRAAEMAELLSKPAAWRATAEVDRLRRAVELRQLINDKYLSGDVRPLKTRTLHSLINDLGGEQALTA